jgi:hypothetical protein
MIKERYMALDNDLNTLFNFVVNTKDKDLKKSNMEIYNNMIKGLAIAKMNLGMLHKEIED